MYIQICKAWPAYAYLHDIDVLPLGIPWVILYWIFISRSARFSARPSCATREDWANALGQVQHGIFEVCSTSRHWKTLCQISCIHTFDSFLWLGLSANVSGQDRNWPNFAHCMVQEGTIRGLLRTCCWQQEPREWSLMAVHWLHQNLIKKMATKP